MTTINTPVAALIRLNQRSDKQLLDDLILSGKLVDASHNSDRWQETTMVRGWIMDELERRNPKAYEAWIMNNDDPSDEALKKFWKIYKS